MQDAIESAFVITARLILVPSLMLWLVRQWPAVREQAAWTRDARADLQWCVLHVLSYPMVAGWLSAFLVLVLASSPSWTEQMASLVRASWVAGRSVPIWAQAALLVVGYDFIAYWVHRLNHTTWFWRFHLIHHSTVELDWLSVYRTHPINFLVERLPFLLLQSWLAINLLPYVLVIFPVGFLTHANLSWTYGPFRYLLVSPTFHRWHHSLEVGRAVNFGNIFSCWDWMFGTAHMPEGRRAETFGVAGNAVPREFLGQLAYPFRRRKSA